MNRRCFAVFVTVFTGALFAQVEPGQCQAEPPALATAPSAGPFSGLAESPQADLFTGAVMTVIRFKVPPGRMDMTPKLALTYSSQGGQGAYGFGWSLPIGRISRSLADGVPEYFNDRDVFVLELPGRTIELVREGGPGSKRYRAKYEGSFLRVGFENGDADYWQVFDKNGTVYTFGKDPGHRYSRIDALPGSTSHATYAWLLESIEDAFGNRIEYTYLAPRPGEGAPRGLPARVEYGGRKNKAHPFAVEFVWDELTYPARPRSSYKARFAQYSGDLYLSAVRTYIDSGAELVREYLLDYEQEVATSGGFTLVGVSLRAYASGGSFVDVPPTVFKYAPAIQTGWPTGPAAERVQYAVEFDGPGEIHDHGDTLGFDTFDINGDGLPDYVDAAGMPPTVRFGTGSGLSTAVPWDWPPSLPYVRRTTSGRLRAAVIDMTGDGLPDLVYAGCGTSADRSWCIYKNHGSGFNLTPELWAAPLGRDYLRRTDPDSGTTSLLTADTLDMNGDGRPDFVDTSLYSSSNPSWRVVRNLGGSFENGYMQINVPAPGLATYVDNSSICQGGWQRAGLVDMNGDGLKDYVLADTGGLESAPGCNGEDHWDVYFNTGGSFKPNAYAWSVEGSDYKLPPYLNNYAGCSDEPLSVGGNMLDLTGDGRSDVVLPHSYDVCGDSQYVAPMCDQTTGSCDVLETEFPEDCCNNLILLVNTGSSFAAPIGWGSTYVGFISAFSYPEDYNFTRYEVMDFDGDGLLDLLEHEPQGDPITGEIISHTWRVYPNPASPFSMGSNTPDEERTRPNLLVSMMNGIGGETLLEYTPASLLGDSLCSYDDQGKPVSGDCLPFPYWTLTRRKTFDVFSTLIYGTSEPRVDNYVYQSPRYDGVEREFRGFARVWAVDPLGMSRATEYHQDDARKGLIRDAWILGNPDCAWNPDGADEACNPWNYALSHVHNDWPDVEANPGRALLLEREVSTPYELSGGGASLPRTDLVETVTYVYDAYGNQQRKVLEYTTPRYSSDGLHSLVTQRVITDSQYAIGEQTSTDGFPTAYNVTKPLRILTYEAGGQNRNLLEKVFMYRKGLLRATSVCGDWAVDGSCMPGAWTENEYRMYKNGLIKGVRTPLRGKRSVRYGKERLYAGRLKNEARLKSEQEHDLRTGKITRAIDAAGRETVSVYDGLGRLLEAWGPDFDGGGATFLESSTRYVEPVIDADDSFASRPGYVVHEAAGEAPIVTFYDGLGRPIASKVLRETVSGLRALVTGLTYYNAAGQVLRLAVPFDAGGGDPEADFELLPVSLYAAVPGWVEQSYEPVTGRLSEIMRPDGERVIHERRVPGVRAESDADFAADPSTGNVRIEMFDAENHLVQIDRCSVMPGSAALSVGCPDSALLVRTSYEYDGLDRVVSVKQHQLESPRRVIETTVYRYDGVGNKVSVFDVDSGDWGYAYNGSGLPIEVRNPSGRVVFYEYDRAGRIEHIREQAGLDSREISYRYARHGFGAGLPESVTIIGPGLSSIEKRLEYNARGLTTRESIHIHTVSTDGDDEDSSYSFSYGYELPDRRTRVSYPSGVEGVDETIVTTYSAFGQPTSLFSDSPGGAVYVAEADYDLYGNLIGLNYGNGVRNLYRYLPPESNGYLVCLRTTAEPGDACSSASSDYQGLWYLTRNRRGQITGILDRVHPYGSSYANHHAAVYDRLGRLLDVTYAPAPAADSESFTYDSLGNMIYKNEILRDFDVVHPHQLARQGLLTFAYDADGNLVDKGNDDIFTYDAGDRLRGVVRGGEMIQENIFDEDGRRLARIEAGTTGTTHYYEDLFETKFDANEIIRHFYFGGRRVASDRVAIRPLVPQAPQQRVFYHPDHLGSPQVITDAAGDVVEYVRYRAYGDVRGVFVEQEDGQIVAKPGGDEPELATNLGFTAQEPDATTGLLYFGTRFYDSDLTHFLSRDPQSQFASPYAYGGFDPLNGIDPDGSLFGLDDAAFALLVKFAAISAATAAAGTLIATGDLGAALQAGAVAGVSTFVLGGAEAGILQALVDKEIVTQTAVEILTTAQIGYGAYRARRGDNPIADLVTISTAAFSLTGVASRHSAVTRQATRDYSRQGLGGSPTSNNGATQGCSNPCLPHLRGTHVAIADDVFDQTAAYIKASFRMGAGFAVGGAVEVGVFIEASDGNVAAGYSVSAIQQAGSKGVEASVGLSGGPGVVTTGRSVELSFSAGAAAPAAPGVVVTAPESGKGILGGGVFYGTSTIPGATASVIETRTVNKLFLRRNAP